MAPPVPGSPQKTARWNPSGWSLVTRIVASSLLLLLLVQLAGFWVVRTAIDRNARDNIQLELVSGERVWMRLLEQNADRLRQGATLLASDFGFRDAVASGDTATLASALANQGQRIGAGITAYLDTRFSLVTVGEGTPLTPELTTALQSVTSAMAADPQDSRKAVIGTVPYQFIMVPLRAPVVVGWVLMGFPIGMQHVGELHALLPVHAAVLARPDGRPLRLVATSLAAEVAAGINASGDTAADLEIDGDTLLARSLLLPAVSGEVRTVLYRSVSEVTQGNQQLQLTLATITALGVLLFGLASGFTASRISQPLRQLVQAAQRMSRGQYNQPVTRVRRQDELGDLARAFERMRVDIAAQQNEIRQLAFWDRLTGLPNRTQFREAVVRAIAEHRNRDDGTGLAVVTLNLDRFKHVNDVMGYEFGDRLLRAVAERLRQRVLRPGDLVARLGGDEFAVLMQNVDRDIAMPLAVSLSRTFDQHLVFDDQTVDLSAGIGLAFWPEHADDVDILMSRSEIAMHAAKRKTAGVLIYDASIDTASTETLSLLTELRTALERRELRLFLQPKVTLSDNTVRTAEALVRWEHPQRGLVPPMQFIPFAEQTGFIRQLTLWMFEEAARQWTALQADGLPLRLAINLSTRDLMDPGFPMRLSRVLEAHGLQPSGFVLEITESAIMDDPERAEQTLNELHDQGFKLSIDDFGTGYSSLAYLKRLPVQELKIDKSFVMGMRDQPDDAKIVRSTIDLAHNLGLTVVAEGVETEAIMAQLAQWSCDEGQGYHMSRPIPAHQFNEWRARWHAQHVPTVPPGAPTLP